MHPDELLRPSVGAGSPCPPPIMGFKHGSNALDSFSATARSSPVILRFAQDLAAARDRPFAEFTLSGAHVLRVTLCDCSTC